jgi:hypothetical protein
MKLPDEFTRWASGAHGGVAFIAEYWRWAFGRVGVGVEGLESLQTKVPKTILLL